MVEVNLRVERYHSALFNNLVRVESLRDEFVLFDTYPAIPFHRLSIVTL